VIEKEQKIKINESLQQEISQKLMEKEREEKG
jgi:hypothetical protein